MQVKLVIYIFVLNMIFLTLQKKIYIISYFDILS